MTAEQAAWIRAQIAEAAAKRRPLDWPRPAFEEPPALLVYATEALFAYYLGPDGTVYALDMDRFAQQLDPVTDDETIRSVYATAADRFPELDDLRPQ